jgi:hypothetical protein
MSDQKDKRAENLAENMKRASLEEIRDAAQALRDEPMGGGVSRNNPTAMLLAELCEWLIAERRYRRANWFPVILSIIFTTIVLVNFTIFLLRWR